MPKMTLKNVQDDPMIFILVSKMHPKSFKNCNIVYTKRSFLKNHDFHNALKMMYQNDPKMHQHSSKILPKLTHNGFKMVPKGSKMAPKTSNMTPKSSKMALKTFNMTPKSSKMAPTTSNMTPKSSKMVPDASKMPPR